MLSENGTDVQFLEEHLQNNPDSILFARLADLYLEGNRIEEAIQLCENGLKEHPYYVTGHLILGKCYLAKKLYDQAEKEFKRVLLFDPKYLAAHKCYGDLMREIGWENTCEMSYKKILLIDPLDEVAQSMVGDYVIEGESAQEEVETLHTEPTDFEEALVDVSPMTENPEEEDLLFQEEDEKATQTYSSQEEPEPEIDEKKAEEFSYILEDIFKDEIADEDIKKPTQQPPLESEEEEQNQEDKSDPDSYLAGLRIPEREEEILNKERESDSTKPEISEIMGDVNKVGSRVESSESSFEADAEPSQRPQKLPKPKGDKIVTPTLGEIYAAQGQYSKAIGVFETLLRKQPENEIYLKKIEDLKQKLNESKNEPKN